MMLMPGPVVVDADVLIRNVEYTIRKGWAGALLGRASGGYSLATGVVLFAAAPAGGEAIRHLPEVAERQGVDLQTVRATWNSLIVPNVRFVESAEGPRRSHRARPAPLRVKRATECG
jgi:hypothetical protein